MIITPAEPLSFASSKVSSSHCLSAASRAAYSAGSPFTEASPAPLEHRLLQVPWTLSVAYVTPLNVQRRFSTHGVENVGVPLVLAVPRHDQIDTATQPDRQDRRRRSRDRHRRLTGAMPMRSRGGL